MAIKDIAGAVIGGAFGLYGQNRQYKYNKRLMEQKFGMDKQMFDYQNAYNTPLNQMRRLKEAGLNPALMYGQGTTGNASDYPKMEAIPTDMSATQIAQSAAAGAQISVMNSQIKLNEANALKSSIEGSVKAGEFGIAKEMSKYQMSKLAAETDNIAQQIVLNKQELTNRKTVDALNREYLKLEKQGYHKGNSVATIMKTVLGIDVSTPEGKKQARFVAGVLLGSKVVGNLSGGFARALGAFKKSPKGPETVIKQYYPKN